MADVEHESAKGPNNRAEISHTLTKAGFKSVEGHQRVHLGVFRSQKSARATSEVCWLPTKG